MAEHNPYQTPEGDVAVVGQGFDKVRIFSTGQRLGRVRYLAYSALSSIALGVLLMLMVGMDALALSGTGELGAGMPVFSILAIVLYYVASVVIGVILGVRRLHDLDKSGWFWLLFLVPIVNIGMAIYVLFFPGSPEANRFGAKPQPNTALTWIAGLAFPLISIIGIIAAVALPAYQQYLERVQQYEQQSEQQSYEQQP